MTTDDRFYAFIVASTSRSRSRIRRISLHKRWLQICIIASVGIVCSAAYGLYGLTQQAVHNRIDNENQRLRAENQKQQEQLNQLNQRVDAVEDKSRRIAEMSGVNIPEGGSPKGKGGPALLLPNASTVASKAARLEEKLQAFESVLRERAVTPSIWPVVGEMTDSFGGRRNPFGGSGSEFHAGQDIATAYGTPVQATANGVVAFAGWQSGCGEVISIEHGDGVTARYGHLAEIGVTVGQQISKGQNIGNVGSSGRSTGPHLHYEVRLNDEAVDPMRYLPGSTQ